MIMTFCLSPFPFPPDPDVLRYCSGLALEKPIRFTSTFSVCGIVPPLDVPFISSRSCCFFIALEVVFPPNEFYGAFDGTGTSDSFLS